MRLATIQGALEIGLDYRRNVPAARSDRVGAPVLDLKAPHNIGDWFVTKVTDRILDYDELVVVERDADQRDWDALNAECDALVLKGGNYLQPRWLSDTFGIDIFRKIRIPIILFGVGVQSGFAEVVRFDPDEVEILRYIHDSSAYSSVRGHATAEALESIGIHNYVVTGCPTVFWSRRPTITVRAAHDASAGFSYRQSLYSEDDDVYRAQLRALDTVRDRFGRVRVILQGEEVLLQRYLQATQWRAEDDVTVERVADTRLRRLVRRPLDPATLAEQIHERYDRWAPRPTLIDWVMRNSFFSHDAGEYLAEYASHGMVVGCRLHSNLVAVANGTPTVFLTYDRRTEELADLFELPRCRLVDFDEQFDLLGQDWRGFEKRYMVHFEELRRFLEANDLPHRLEVA
jgi:polysaccharide pyruvyl transferase WcaK-like protein